MINEVKRSDITIMSSSWKEYKVTGNWKNCRYGFGCYAEDTETGAKVVLTGNQTRLLDNGDMIQASVIRNDRNWRDGTPWYKAAVLLPVMRSKNDVIDYFSSASFSGIGKKAAEDIYDTLGMRAPYLLLQDISNLDKVPLSVRKKAIIRQSLDSTRELDRIATLYPVFSRRPKLLEALSERATCFTLLPRLQKDPYQFIGEIPGFTFSVAEEIAYANGMDGHGECRREKLMSYALRYVLNNNYGGDTYINLADNRAFTAWIDTASHLSGQTIPDWFISREELASHVQEMENTGSTKLVMHNGEPHMTLRAYDKAEDGIAGWVSDQIASGTVVNATVKQIYRLIDEYMNETGDMIDDTQRLAVITAIRSPLSIISGGPGRGKTRVAACVAWVFDKLSAKNSHVVLTSFTGKATRRLMESVHESFDGVTDMSTMLRFVYREKARQYKNEKLGKKSPDMFKGNLVIIDEASMIDIDVMWKFLSIVHGAQVLIMGDVNQLPSIGAGQTLRDLIDSDVIPVTMLVTCYRASSGILVGNAEAILEDRLSDVVYDDKKFVWTAKGGHELVDAMADEYLGMIDRGYDASDITMLSGFSSLRDPLSVYDLNAAVQSKRKDLGFVVPKLTYGTKDRNVPIHIGDRCIMTHNAPEETYCDKSRGVIGEGLFNGDMGFIRDADKYGVKFETDDGRMFTLSYERAQDLELAYAMTIHKSQGSEYSVVLLAVSPRFAEEWATKTSFGSKNLLYTALTRAKNEVHFYGSERGWNTCLSTLLPARHTHLRDFLQGIR